jgi:hypothetical protein
MSTTTNLSTLKINVLTQAQYDALVQAGTVNADEIYLTPENGSVTETDPVFTASVAHGITANDVQKWDVNSRIDFDNSNFYPIINIKKVTYSGVSGVAVSYDDGTIDGGVLFFADGNGLTTVKTAIEAQIPTVPTNVSAFTNDSGYLTSYTETDPTVPSWAKASTKPTYTASEVGALANTGGQVTGDITLYVESGNSPAIIFQRGTLTDNYNDWKIYDKSGFLYFAQRGSGSSAFGDVGYINTSGVAYFRVPWSYIDSKPTFATVATSGSYNDLSDKPTIPTGLPAVTSSDNGKVLRVVNGAWSAVSLPSASGVSF